MSEDKNRLKDLIASRRGYSNSARVLTKILRMFRAAGSRSTNGPAGAGLYQKAMCTILRGKRKQLFTSRKQARDSSISFSGSGEDTLFVRKKTE